MDFVGMSGSPIGTLVPIDGHDARHQADYRSFAYVPEPLPENIELSTPTWTAVAAAMNALGRLDQIGKQLPDAEMFMKPSIRREAVSTSALEGTHAAMADVIETELADGIGKSPEVIEVRNYIRAAEVAFASINNRGLTLGLLMDLQAILVKDTASSGSDDGRIRTHQVLIEPKGCTVEEARFIPPPPGDVLVAGVQAWEQWLTGPHEAPAVVQAALAHYQFETLHPFADGNGRIGRLIVVLQLMQLGELGAPLLAISPYLEANADSYRNGLLELSQSGNWDPWVRFFAGAVRAAADQTVNRIERLLSFQEQVRELIRTTPLRGVAAFIAEDLISQPVITPTYAAKRHQVSYPTANQAVTKLQELGIVREVTGGSYDRLFVASEVLRIIQT